MPETVSIIGTGKLGSALARGLHGAGYAVRFIASKPPSGAEQMATELGAEVIDEPYNEIAGTDIIFLTVPDDEIEKIAVSITENSASDFRGKTFVHCSGAKKADILKPLADKGAVILSLHPLQTFPPGCGAERFRDVFFAVEGEDCSVGEEIARALGGTPFRIDSKKKGLYHASAVLASNYLFGLAIAAGETLENAGIEGEDPAKILNPLMQGTLDTIRQKGAAGGITGPLSRGDVETVKQQIECLKETPELLNVYKCLGKFMLDYLDIPGEKKDKFRNLFQSDKEKGL